MLVILLIVFVFGKSSACSDRRPPVAAHSRSMEKTTNLINPRMYDFQCWGRFVNLFFPPQMCAAWAAHDRNLENSKNKHKYTKRSELGFSDVGQHCGFPIRLEIRCRLRPSAACGGPRSEPGTSLLFCRPRLGRSYFCKY